MSLGREKRRSPLRVEVFGLPRPDDRRLTESRRVAGLEDAEVIRWAFLITVGQQEDDLFKYVREDALLEEGQIHRREAFEQEAADRGGVVHGQKLGREHQSQASALAEEECGVNGERRPRRSEV